MKEVSGDLWKHPADIIVITTNSSTRSSDGAAVMGRGVAAQAKAKFPRLPAALGALLKKKGNHVHYLGAFQRQLPPKMISDGFYDDLVRWDIKHIISFPVKNHWNLRATTELIYRSAIELNYLVHIILPSAGIKADVVVMPRPGCGNGKLEWTTVRAVIEPHLDDRFVIIERRI